MIPRLPFGRSGHLSSRVVFGAAALWRASEAEAEAALALLLETGVNHIDVAASYGDAELHVGRWMPRHRRDFFLASKTGDRDYAGARDSIQRSLDRLRTDQLDLIQLHNLVKEDEWLQALGEDGALQACVEAREEGLVRFIGVTGHGSQVAARHLQSLERFDFDSVLLPYSLPMLQNADYARDLEALLSVCEQRRIAVQTIKSIARRRWPEGAATSHDTWYEPFTAAEEIERCIHWALARPGVFVNSAGDLRLLPAVLAAAAGFDPVAAGSDTELSELIARGGAQPLWLHGYRAGD
jgi:aryl-alcohol dehydrogenase-like predicted oxidoreductase